MDDRAQERRGPKKEKNQRENKCTERGVSKEGAGPGTPRWGQGEPILYPPVRHWAQPHGGTGPLTWKQDASLRRPGVLPGASAGAALPPCLAPRSPDTLYLDGLPGAGLDLPDRSLHPCFSNPLIQQMLSSDPSWDHPKQGSRDTLKNKHCCPQGRMPRGREQYTQGHSWTPFPEPRGLGHTHLHTPTSIVHGAAISTRPQRNFGKFTNTTPTREWECPRLRQL